MTNFDMRDKYTILDKHIKIMKPSIAVQLHRDEILKIISKSPVKNPRIFGSIARGTDSEDSDIDILVDSIKGETTLIHLAIIKNKIEEITGKKNRYCNVFIPSRRYKR